ncbi:EamA family transporter, partial [Bacillus pumilus]|uniref:EamA family transporter n=1 Tax=Bacillus pumilus TaxID=1408 RepID=UPI0021B33CD8
MPFSFFFLKIPLQSPNPIHLFPHPFTLSFPPPLFLFPFLPNNIPLSIQSRHLLYILPFSFLYPLLFFPFQLSPLIYTSSSHAPIIHATIPIFTILLAASFLKQP